MKTRSKTEIIVETCRTLTIRSANRSRLGWCEECGHRVQLVSAAEAAIMCRVSSRTIYRLIEAGEFHFREIDGMVLICAGSLETVDKEMKAVLVLAVDNPVSHLA
jgi:N-acetylglutamate synthase-like GNAT family acetyltransferase